MDDYTRRLTNPVLTWGFGLLLGVLIGLIVLGWWLFPVVWVDASPADLLYDYQVDSLRADIEAYAYTGDVLVAQARYESLGESAETALAQIVQNPGSLPPALLASFSQEVAGVPVDELATMPVEVPEPQVRMDTWIAILGALLLVVAAVLLTYLVLRVRRKDEDKAELEASAASPVVEEKGEAGSQEGLDLPPFLAAAGLARTLDPSESAAEETDLMAGDEMVTWEEDVQVVEETPLIEEEIPEAEDSGPESVTAPAEVDHLGVGAGFAVAALAASELFEPEEEASTPEGIEILTETVGEPEFETEFGPESGTPEIDTDEGLVEEPAFEEGLLQEDGNVAEAALAAAGLASFLRDEDATQEEPFSETLADEYPADETQLEGIVPPEILTGESAPKIVPSGSGKAASHEPVEIKMRKRLEFIEGIGPVYAAKLLEAGIETTGKLLAEGLSRKGRKDLAGRAGIPEKLILEWVNHVDLYRIKGVGSEYADLLEATGVDTIPELAQRRADNLYQAIDVVNSQRRLVRQLPSEVQVADWIEQAKELPRIIQY